MSAQPPNLFNPPLGSVHVYDMCRDTTLYPRHLSDLVVGMLWFANRESVVTQTIICDNFITVFHPHLRFRSDRVHAGNPFLDPDGRVMLIRGIRYDGGDATLPSTQLTDAQLHTHPGYDAWLSNLLFAGNGRYDSQYHADVMSGLLVAPAVSGIPILNTGSLLMPPPPPPPSSSSESSE